MKPSICYIILSYHTDPDVLKKNLHILKDSTVCIVDNTEDEEKRVKKLKPVLSKSQIIIENPTNSGYTGGMNRGIAYAKEQHADWIVLLNDDVHISTKSISTLENILYDSEPAILGPFGGYLDERRWTTILPKVVNEESPVQYISGSFMVMHKNVVEVVQSFYPDYFMYYEDVDICIQAAKAKFPLIKIYLPDISHKDGTSIERGSQLHEYYLARNHLLFVERQAPLIIKLHEFLRIPWTLWEYKYGMNSGGFRGVIDFIFTRYGKAPASVQ